MTASDPALHDSKIDFPLPKEFRKGVRAESASPSSAAVLHRDSPHSKTRQCRMHQNRNPHLVASRVPCASCRQIRR